MQDGAFVAQERVESHDDGDDWRRGYADFPAPVAHLQQALVSHWREVEKWAKATGL